MCYRCEVCKRVVGAKQPKRTYALTRLVPCQVRTSAGMVRGEREEIEQEIPVCHPCQLLLENGLSLAVLRKRYETEDIVMPTPKPVNALADKVVSKWRTNPTNGGLGLDHV